MNDSHRQIFEKNLIDKKQFEYLDAISTGKLISVFYELRTLLYLGVLLFSGGIGILIYKNIGQIGHIISLVILCLVTLACAWYVFKNKKDYFHEQVGPPTPYFDYILLLGSLLLICIQAYLQFLFGLWDSYLGSSSLITAMFFFYIAYRYDHLGILSMAITAFAAYWGINVSLQRNMEFFASQQLYLTGIIFSTALAAAAIYLNRVSIKEHFTFTYINFCSLIFFISALTGLFSGDTKVIYLLLISAGCVASVYYANWKRSFLFLLYAFVFGYIGFTYLVSLLLKQTSGYMEILWFYYPFISCAAFIYFIIKFKNRFKQNS
jgi:hypothetical protein